MPRTTVDLDSHLHRRLKRIALDEGQSLSRTINRILANALHERRGVQIELGPGLQWTVADGGAVNPEFDFNSRAYLDRIDEVGTAT